MKHLQTSVSQRVFLPALILTTIFLLTSCRVQLLPAYDAKQVELIEQTSRECDLLYILMLESDDRQYEKWMEPYAEIEANLGLLLLKSANKPLNKHSVRIAEITLEIWQKYKTQHKQNAPLSDATITLNRMYMADLFNAMLVAEKAKELLGSLPE
ncbi:MAG: hypothetical protein KJ578_13750 [Bacteroidetes bacterium]|nr:hypothetical protein [Bacteroidota bacterium]MBU1580991.1 hypothetical protein [Bacteroidota bacterium]MBU2558836.1 hypothetical protein [Bacteroidota bacterium]